MQVKQRYFKLFHHILIISEPEAKIYPHRRVVLEALMLINVMVRFFIVGFCITVVTPAAYQYGAKITLPASEGTSNGIFDVMVQASGLLIVMMDTLRGVFHNSYIPFGGGRGNSLERPGR